MSLYHLTVTVHLLAALLWLGGMFFFAAVGAPVLRGVEPPALRQDLFRRLGEGFRVAGWIAIAILLVTGVALLHFRGWLRAETWADPGFRASAQGRALVGKLAAVAFMLVASAVHDFILGPASARLDAHSPAGVRTRRRSAWLARANALVAILLVAFAVRVVRG